MDRSPLRAALRAVVLVFLLGTGPTIRANGIQVSNAELTAANAVDGYMMVRFNVAWENSWRTSSPPNNWDAAWVFIKFRVSSGPWRHAWLNNDGHLAPPGSVVNTGLLDPGDAYDPTVNPGLGVFLHRSADGAGTFSAEGVELRWNFAANGIGCAEVTDVRVFAIEMVYVPQGSFAVGSGGTELNRFKNGSTDNPFVITSEAAFQMGNTVGQLWASGQTLNMAATLPAEFPKGFAAFYCMKYELTQQGYVDFLNMLTREQQNARVQINVASGQTSTGTWAMWTLANPLSGPPSFRNSIRCDATFDANDPITFYCDLNGNGTGGEVDDGQWVVCNYIGAGHLGAYLDWSGLRPMTELEFEKACRGTQDPLPNEYPWGTTGIAGSLYTLGNPGASFEGISANYATMAGNAANSSTTNIGAIGPFRTGIFAAHASSSGRETAGGSYYGAMELAGNLAETVITLHNATGRAFTGAHGDGDLAANGNQNVTGWPTGTGTGYRGGAFQTNSGLLCVSSRQWINMTAGVSDYSGGRGVRTAP